MLRVLTVSSRSERSNADHLARLVIEAWPGIMATQTERVTIAAGLKLVRETDLLVTFEFDAPRAIAPRIRRNGTHWPGGLVQAGAIVIECKALDASRLISVGNDLRPIYAGKRAAHTVLDQLKSQVDGITMVLNRYSVERCFIHGLAWMTGATEAELLAQAPALSPFILGSDVTWEGILAAAAIEHASIATPANDAYRAAVRFATERLTRERRLSARDVAKLDRFTTEVLARDVAGDLMEKLGTHQIRLVGGPGSGKSTTLALVAKRALERDDARILFLTYHHALRNELEHLIRTILGPTAAPPEGIVVSTLHDFLLPFFVELGGDVPLTAHGTTDYGALPAAIGDFLNVRGGATLRNDAASLRELMPQQYAFDYAFIDEAQDWRPELRDLLRLLFPAATLVLADGVDQFAQRQTRCDWTGGVPKEQRYVRQLNRSLRMSANVARFVTAFARAMGYDDWRVDAHPDLTGGRVILAPDASDPTLIERVLAIASEAGVSAGDCLIAVPPTLVETGPDGKRARIAAALAESGNDVWDATDERVRVTARQPAEIAIVPYGSIRGLEGWAAVLLDLDAWDANRLRHPNVEAGETTSADDVARRALLLALTRAAHVLVITTSDPASRAAQWLEEAAAESGEDIIERW
jgi:hypothetical protein